MEAQWVRLAAAFVIGFGGWLAVGLLGPPIEAALAAAMGLGVAAGLVAQSVFGLAALWLGVAATIVLARAVNPPAASGENEGFYLLVLALLGGVGYAVALLAKRRVFRR